MTKQVTNIYLGYTLVTTPNGEAKTTLIYKGAEMIGASFSHLDKLSSVEKAQAKIRLWESR